MSDAPVPGSWQDEVDKTLAAARYTAAHIPLPPQGDMTGRQYLDWAVDECLKLYDDEKIVEARMLLDELLPQHPATRWITSHPMLNMHWGLGIRGGHAELEKQLKGFNVR